MLSGRQPRPLQVLDSAELHAPLRVEQSKRMKPEKPQGRLPSQWLSEVRSWAPALQRCGPVRRCKLARRRPGCRRQCRRPSAERDGGMGESCCASVPSVFVSVLVCVRGVFWLLSLDPPGFQLSH